MQENWKYTFVYITGNIKQQVFRIISAQWSIVYIIELISVFDLFK